MRVVLFDIDGTLLRSGGAGRVSMERALDSVFGARGDPLYRYDGKTDRQIVRELMRAEGFSDEEIDAQMTELLDAYLAHLRDELDSGAKRVTPLPGVMSLLGELEQRPEVVLGLLTGNIEQGAHAKLTAAGIDPQRFRVNAYGSDHEERPQLPAVAQQRAGRLLEREIAGDRLIVIGDTPADIACGESVGARSIGVATGHFTVEHLTRCGAYAVFPDFSHTDAVLAAIMNA